MEELIENPGLCHLVRNISSYLDLNSLAQCRLVSKSWSNLIDNDRQWLIYQLEHIHSQEKAFIDFIAKGKPTVKTSIKERFPEWYAFIQQVLRKQTIPRLNNVVKMMWFYLKLKDIDYYRNPIHHFVAHSSEKTLQLLIDCGIDLSMRNPMGYTSMHYACAHGSRKTVEFLVKHGATSVGTFKTNKVWTIFHMAAINKDPRVLELILDLFRYEDDGDNDDWPNHLPILHFSIIDDGPKATIQFMLESHQSIGINLEQRTNDLGSTILHFACSRDFEIVELVVKALKDIQSDIDFYTQDFDGNTPIHYACSSTSDVAIKMITRYPHLINADHAGRNILHYACLQGNMNLVKFIFGNSSFDIDYNVVDEEGNTPLHVACIQGQFEVVKFILEEANQKGIDIAKKNMMGQTAEDLARNNGHKDVVDLFKTKLLKIIQTVLIALIITISLILFLNFFNCYIRLAVRMDAVFLMENLSILNN